MNCTNKQQETADCEKRGCEGCFYNDEIQVGEYVRTKTGRIYKLSYYSKEEERWICVTDEDWFPIYESEIVKHSSNIIDLIEVRRLCKWKKSCI